MNIVVIILDAFRREAVEVEATSAVEATFTIYTNDKIHLMLNKSKFLNPARINHLPYPIKKFKKLKLI